MHHPPAPDLPPGSNGFKAIAGSIFTAFADVHVTSELVLKHGDMMVERSMVRATHSGPFQGIAATGRKVTWNENSIYRVMDGRIAEIRVCADLLGIVRQLQ